MSDGTESPGHTSGTRGPAGHPRAGRPFPRSSPYWPVLNHPLLRRVLPGMAVSAFGDGMALVAISWLALELAPGRDGATWVALAVAAYTLPATLGTMVFGRLLAGRASAQLVYWDSVLRGVMLMLIPVLHIVGLLTPLVFVVLLALSSLLHSWGVAGRFTLIAEVLPEQHHIPANALLSIFTGAATVVGPPVAGLLIAWQGAATVLALDAASFVVLAVSCLFAGRSSAAAPPTAAPSKDRSSVLKAIRRDHTMLGLLLLTFVFFVFFGPVYVALPVYVDQVSGSAALLGVYYTAFGAGSLIGAVATGYAGRLPLWWTTIGIVIGFGLTLLPMAVGAPMALSLAGFALGGFIWTPYMSVSRALLQRRVRPDQLAGVLAVNTALIIPAVPLGTIVGGPLVVLLGARGALLACAVATIALGLVAAAFFGWTNRGNDRSETGSGAV